jgi:hypothetical protein
MTTLYIENEFQSTWPKYSKKYAGAVPISMFGPLSYSFRNALGHKAQSLDSLDCKLSNLRLKPSL